MNSYTNKKVKNSLNRKESIMIIVPSLSGGGQERMAVQTADILLKNYDVSIVIFSNEKRIYNSNAEIININIPSKKGFINKTLQQLKRILKLSKIRQEKKPIAVFSFGNTANITNAFSGNEGIKIISLRGYANINKNLIDEAVYRKAHTITCISNEMIRKLHELYPITKNKTKLLYNGIDIFRIHKLSKQVDINLKLPKTKKIITAGRLTDVKGHRQLLKSFALLKGVYDNVSLIILGDGENRNILNDLSKQLGISDSVCFLGFHSNLYSIMTQCDFFVLPSIHEGFGNVIVEAMACELPVISTACLSGPAEILGSNSYNVEGIEYSNFGILVPAFESDYSMEKNKEEMLANAMLKMLSNKDIYQCYQKKLMKRAEEFSIESYERNIQELLKNLCNDK